MIGSGSVSLKMKLLVFFSLTCIIYISSNFKHGTAESYQHNDSPCGTCSKQLQFEADTYASSQEKKVYQEILKQIFCAINCPSQVTEIKPFIKLPIKTKDGKLSLRVEICKFYCSRLKRNFERKPQDRSSGDICTKIFLPEFKKLDSSRTIAPYFSFVDSDICWDLDKSTLDGHADSTIIRTSMLSMHIKESKNKEKMLAFSDITDEPSQPTGEIPVSDVTTTQQILNGGQSPIIVGYDAYGQPIYTNNYGNDPTQQISPLSIEGSSNQSDSTQIQEHPKSLLRPNFCFDYCECLPYLIGSLIITLIYFGGFAYALHISSSLFSKGIFSSSFFRGGGEWFLVATLTGLLAGGIIAGFTTYCIAISLLAAASWMTLAYSIILVGKRGAIFGSLGGIGFGSTVGYMISPTLLNFVVGAVIGLMVGLIFGFFPFARALKMNERYIREGLISGRDSDQPSAGRRYSDDYVERRSAGIAKANQGEKRRSSWAVPLKSESSGKNKDDLKEEQTSSAKPSSAHSDDTHSVTSVSNLKILQ